METIEVAKKHMLLLPYQEDEDISLTIFLFFFLINKHLPSNVKMQVTFTGQNLTDRTKFEHKHRDIYFGKFPEKNCANNCLANSASRISERILDHGGRIRNPIFLIMV